MANEIQVATASGRHLYALLLNATGLAWNGAAFEAVVNADWASYAVALTESGTTGVYVASFPITAPAGVYSAVAYLRAGSSPAVGDPVLGSAVFQWDGAKEVALAAAGLAPTGLDAALDAATIGGGTLRQALRAMAAVLAGASFVEVDNGDGSTTTSVSDFLDAATARVTGVETDAARSVTIH